MLAVLLWKNFLSFGGLARQNRDSPALLPLFTCPYRDVPDWATSTKQTPNTRRTKIQPSQDESSNLQAMLPVTSRRYSSFSPSISFPPGFPAASALSCNANTCFNSFFITSTS